MTDTTRDERLNELFRLADQARAGKDFVASLDHLTTLVTEFPDCVKGHLHRGLNAIDVKSFPLAEASFRAAIALEPGKPDGYYYMGYACWGLGDLVASRAFFKEAYDRDPAFRNTLEMLINASLERGYTGPVLYEETIALLDEMLVKDPCNPGCLKHFLFEYWLRTEYDKLDRLCRSLKPATDLSQLPILKDSPWMTAEGQLALKARRREAWDQVAAHFEQVLAERPGWAEAHLEYARALEHLGRPEEARAQCQHAHRLNPKLFIITSDLATQKISRGLLDQGFEDMRLAVFMNPGHFDLTSRLQDAFFHYGRMDLADGITQVILDENAKLTAHLPEPHGRSRLLRIYTNQIGHMGHLDWYLKMDRLGRRSPVPPQIVAQFSANDHFLEYWRPLIPDLIREPQQAQKAIAEGRYQEDGLCAVLDASGRQTADYSYRTQVEIQKQWAAEGRGPLLTLREADLERGRACLEQAFGLPRGDWFVSLHVRADVGSSPSDGGRNVGIASYDQAIREITDRGGWVIRMGDSGMPRLEPRPRVIDYAHSPQKSDWMDVFLWGACRFFIGTNSGPIFIPPCFGVPVVVTNWMPFGIPDLFLDSLCIFKNYWSDTERRFLSFPEVVASSLGYTNVPNLLAGSGLHLVENSSEEIRDVVLEMLERLEGGRPYTEADNALQERFDRVPGKVPGVGRIGRAFLRKYEGLFEPPPGRP